MQVPTNFYQYLYSYAINHNTQRVNESLATVDVHHEILRQDLFRPNYYITWHFHNL